MEFKGVSPRREKGIKYVGIGEQNKERKTRRWRASHHSSWVTITSKYSTEKTHDRPPRRKQSVLTDHKRQLYGKASEAGSCPVVRETLKGKDKGRLDSKQCAWWRLIWKNTYAEIKVRNICRHSSDINIRVSFITPFVWYFLITENEPSPVPAGAYRLL